MTDSPPTAMTATAGATDTCPSCGHFNGEHWATPYDNTRRCRRRHGTNPTTSSPQCDCILPSPPEPAARHGVIEYDDHEESLTETTGTAIQTVARGVPRWFGRLVVAALAARPSRGAER